MAAFLFLPVAAGTHRRVDFANIAALFAEIEEPVAVRAQTTLAARLLAFLLILLIAVGDMVLVARPDAAAYSPPVSALQSRSVTSL